jgi:hypothetical protein
MTKKTKIVYVYLALFAFTLGFSFTLASQTQADPGPVCCIYEWCTYYNPPTVGVKGHLSGGACVFDGTHPCDTAWLCPYSGE